MMKSHNDEIHKPELKHVHTGMKQLYKRERKEASRKNKVYYLHSYAGQSDYQHTIIKDK